MIAQMTPKTTNKRLKFFSKDEEGSDNPLATLVLRDFKNKSEGKMYIIADPIRAPLKLTTNPTLSSARAINVVAPSKRRVIFLFTFSLTSFPTHDASFSEATNMKVSGVIENGANFPLLHAYLFVVSWQ